MDQLRRLAGVIAISTLIQFGSPGTALAAPEPSTLFKTKCGSCHTFGKGDLIGPDLKGVTQRHSRPWLIAWIRSSETQIRRGDAVGEALFRKYRQQRMPDHDLSDAQIAALLDYLHAGGPAADEQQHLRLAVDATPQDSQLGRKLFFGEERLVGGAVACVFCHTVSKQTRLGGSLAPDLTGAYPRFLDWALDQRLRRPCVHGTAAPDAARVAEAESLALRAFFRSVSIDVVPGRMSDRGSDVNRTSSGR
jgi:mono/diheme cytochrome c family protein